MLFVNITMLFVLVFKIFIIKLLYKNAKTAAIYDATDKIYKNKVEFY